jgi:transposase
MKRRYFTDEFKREAVALLASGGRPLEHVARELGIQPSVLRNWRRRELEPGGMPRLPNQQAAPPLVPGDQAAEIARLKKEVERLRMERDILKKPSLFSRSRRDEVPRHRGLPGRVSGPGPLFRPGGVAFRLLRLAVAASERSHDGKPKAARRHSPAARSASSTLRCSAHACRPRGRGLDGELGPGRPPDAPPRHPGRKAQVLPGLYHRQQSRPAGGPEPAGPEFLISFWPRSPGIFRRPPST